MDDSDPAARLTTRFPAKRAFITGAASGLGRALALEFACAGWRLGILDISSEGVESARSELQAAGARLVSHYVGSVGSEPFVSASVADFAERLGGLDVMINDAGVAVAGPLEATSPDDWCWIVDTNLLGVVWGCRAALPLMRRAGAGIILNIASAAGFAAAPNMSAYNATKAAVISLSETLAAETGDSSIQVSCAMPGFFRSHLVAGLRAPPAERAAARRLLEGSSHSASEAARAILAGVADSRLYIVWPREYRALWHMKRLAPLLFLKEARKLTAAELAGPRQDDTQSGAAPLEARAP
jgi:NAD(P)-dependent dehydrogenase (short-subunit alcohol dehydrogenase family)